MTRILPLLALLLLALPANADPLDPPPVRYPTLTTQAQNAAGFVPKGWVLEAQASGDLNADGLPDIAFVLRDNDRKNVLANDNGLGSNPFNTNPRILGVGFAQAGGGYALALQNHTLITRRDNPSMNDPFDAQGGGIEIARGALNVRLSLFMSAGGWGMFNSRFTFRWQNGAFQLIGFEQNSTERNTGATELVSVNYATHRMQVTTGSIENDKTNTKTTRLPDKPLLTLEQVGDGIEFNPGG